MARKGRGFSKYGRGCPGIVSQPLKERGGEVATFECIGLAVTSNPDPSREVPTSCRCF